MALTLHLDGSDADHLFKTYDAGGNHSGNPADGERPVVWDDEGDGIADVICRWTAGAVAMTYKSTSSPMRKPCVYFGSPSVVSQNQNGTAAKALSNFITASAYHVFVAFRVDNATGSNASPWLNPSVFGDVGGFWCLAAKVGPILVAYNWDGTADSVSQSFATATDYLAVMRHDAGTVYFDLYNTAGGVASVSVVSGNTSTLTNQLQIGGSLNGNVIDGYLGELKIYDAVLTGTALSTQVAYFQSKWLGISPGMPAVRPRTRRWRFA